MQRFTISLDDELAAAFDGLVAQRGYATRSEAVRDLIREQLGSTLLASAQAPWCVATVSFVHDHHDAVLAARLGALQHDHHDLVLHSTHTFLDHDNCLETLVLRGRTEPVQALAAQLIALRGVRSGQVHAVPLAEEARGHRHPHAGRAKHRHLRPAI